MTDSSAVPVSAAINDAPRARRLRVWFPVGLVLLYWAARLIVGYLDVPVFIRFMVPMAVSALMTLAIPIWWLCQKRISLSGRFAGLAALIVVAVAATLLNRDFMAIALVMTALPIVLSAWVLWLACAARASAQTIVTGTLAAVCLPWVPFMLVRMDGLT